MTTEATRADLELYLTDGYRSVVGMSSLFAARIATRLALAQTAMGVRGHIAEIGVFKGRFFIAMALALAEGERAIAIDDFHHPDQYRQFTENLALYRVPPNIVVAIASDTLHFDYERFDTSLVDQSVRFFHVDGRHKRANLSNDLLIAARRLHDAGVICVDDMQHPCYPLLGRAVDRFLADRPELVVFCVIDREDIVGAGKYLICRREHASRYAEFLSKTFAANRFMPADFERYKAIVLTPDPKRLEH